MIEPPKSIDQPAKSNFGLRFRLACIAGELCQAKKLDKDRNKQIANALSFGVRSETERIEIPAELAEAWKVYPGRERYAAFELWPEEKE